LRTARLSEVCLVGAASTAVCALLHNRLPLLRPGCRLKVLEEAVHLELWELASEVVMHVAPFYSVLRTEGWLENIPSEVEDVLRDGYAGLRQQTASFHCA